MDYIGQLLAAAAVLGLLGTALWWLKRRGLAGLAAGPRSGGRKLETLERLALTPQHTLHLVRVGERRCWLPARPRVAACWSGFRRGSWIRAWEGGGDLCRGNLDDGRADRRTGGVSRRSFGAAAVVRHLR